MSRPIFTIASEIRKDWRNVNYAADPYLEAMMDLTDINDTFGADNARSIVSYFLANAQSWRGETAKRIKAELKLAIASGAEKRRVASYLPWSNGPATF